MSGNSPISKQLHKKKTGEWSETCYGVWTRRMTDISNGRSSDKSSKNSNRNSTSFCTGISLVRVRDLDVTSIETTRTLGLQIIIRETIEQREPIDSTAVNSSDDLFASAVRLNRNIDENIGELVKGGAENLKNGAYDFAETLRKWSTSEDAQVLKRVAYNEYRQFRKWLESLWK